MESGSLPAGGKKAALGRAACKTTKPGLRRSFGGRGRNERFIVTATVDRRNLRSHWPQVRRQLATVVDAVIVQESEIQGGGQVEHSEKFDRRQQLLRCHFLYACNAALHVLVIPRHDFG